jgi:hypothetical protein
MIFQGVCHENHLNRPCLILQTGGVSLSLAQRELTVFDSAPMFKGTLIYHDEHHLNERGAQVYGKFAAPLLRKYIQF